MTLADVKPHLRTLLGERDVSDPISREAESNIKMIGEICGMYLTASEVQSYVASLSPTDDNKKKHIRPRGFELAGELYYLHLHEEVNAIEEHTKSLGPKIFRSYCTELFGCFLAGEHVRKGVGYPIMLMEALLSKAITSLDKRSRYLALADQAMESMAELSKHKFKKDGADAMKTARKMKKHNAPKPETTRPHEVIDRRLLEHLQSLYKGYAVVRAGFEEAKPPRTSSGKESVVRDYVAYLQELLNAATQGRYLGLTAVMKIKLGQTLHRARQNKCIEYLLSAAEDLEKLAAEEQELYLVVMSAQHYRKAHELYSFLGEQERAEATGGLLAKLKSDYDPQMLIVSQL